MSVGGIPQQLLPVHDDAFRIVRVVKVPGREIAQCAMHVELRLQLGKPMMWPIVIVARAADGRPCEGSPMRVTEREVNAVNASNHEKEVCWRGGEIVEFYIAH